MSLYLVNPGVELTLELHISPVLENAVAAQWERIQDRSVRATFVRRIERQLERLLNESMDWDLKEPTPAQLSYAGLIARSLDIEIPADALRNRFHMAIFIDTYGRRMHGQSAHYVDDETHPARIAHQLVTKRIKPIE